MISKQRGSVGNANNRKERPRLLAGTDGIEPSPNRLGFFCLPTSAILTYTRAGLDVPKRFLERLLRVSPRSVHASQLFTSAVSWIVFPAASGKTRRRVKRIADQSYGRWRPHARHAT